MTKLKLDLYYVKTNSFNKFEVDISNYGHWEKFRKQSGRTDRQTDWWQGNL